MSLVVKVTGTLPEDATPIPVQDGGDVIDLITIPSGSSGIKYAVLPEGQYLGQKISIRRLVQGGGFVQPSGVELRVVLGKSRTTPAGFIQTNSPRYAYMSFLDPTYTADGTWPSYAVLMWTGNDWLIESYTRGVGIGGTP